MPKRYWVRILDLPWQEISEEKFLVALARSGTTPDSSFFGTPLVDGVITTGDTKPSDALATILSIERILGSEVTCTDYDR